jgi:Fructose-bisphosphate aldolase class-II
MAEFRTLTWSCTADPRSRRNGWKSSTTTVEKCAKPTGFRRRNPGGIRHGVRKVNIDTDLRVTSTGAIRNYLAENKSVFDPRKFLQASTAAMRSIGEARYRAFGCAGHASKINPCPLPVMVTRYAKGER